MITTAQQILASFETLSDTDKHTVAIEILRRTSIISEDDMIESLHAAAAEGFAQLDAEEREHGGSPSSAK